VSSSPTSTEAPASPAAAAREARLAAGLVFGAMLVGAVLQIWVPPGPLTLVAATAVASLVVLGLSLAVPGRLRTTLAGFRFTSTLLIALSVFAVIGTLVLQGKPQALYRQRYGVFGPLIIALRFDDIFHGLPFAGLTALFGAAILASATLRWPISTKRAGFFVAHLGLMISGAGAAASSVLSVHGRIDLLAGGDVATEVRVSKAGLPSGAVVPLGFELKLDQFDLVNYETEYRIGYYEKTRVMRNGVALEDFRLKTSFDPDLERHRLPAGDSFRLKAIYPDFTTTSRVVPSPSGQPAQEVTLGGLTRWLLAGEHFVAADGRTAVAFGRECPPPPPGVLTAFLVCGAERKVVIHTGDGELTSPLSEGLQLAGGALRIGASLPAATRITEYGTRSAAWKNPAALLESHAGGGATEQLVMALQPKGVFLSDRAGLIFERRDKEVKAFRSHVSARLDGEVERAVISVNDPFVFGGWTLYQVNYNPEEPNYSGLEAVRDPGVPWVFFGFTLICLGVGYLFYVEPRLRGGIERPPDAGSGAA
jgi:hypothetical protein